MVSMVKVRCLGTGGAVVFGTSRSLSVVMFSVLLLALISLLLLDDDKFNMLVALDELDEDANSFFSPALRGGSGGARCSSSDLALVNTFPDPDVTALELGADDADARTDCFVFDLITTAFGSLLVSVIFVWVAKFPLTLCVVVEATAAECVA